MADSEEEIKSLLRVKEKSEKAGLKLNIKRTKKMASVPITSWQIDGDEDGNRHRLYFFRRGWHPKLLQMVTAAMKLKGACFLKEKL